VNYSFNTVYLLVRVKEKVKKKHSCKTNLELLLVQKTLRNVINGLFWTLFSADLHMSVPEVVPVVSIFAYLPLPVCLKYLEAEDQQACLWRLQGSTTPITHKYIYNSKGNIIQTKI